MDIAATNTQIQQDDEIDIKDIDNIISDIGQEPQHVIPILQAVQEKYNYLPPVALDRIAETTDILPADITGVATFYSQFRLRPAGRHSIKVCIGTACYVMGAEDIYDAFKVHLDIPGEEDTDKDRLFTVEKVACLGCCMLAPAVQIDDITYGFVNPNSVDGVLRDFLESQQKGESAQAQSDGNGKPPTGEVKMCLCSSCIASGAKNVFDALNQNVQQLSLPIRIKTVGCTGEAFSTPLIELAINGSTFRYGNVKAEDVQAILLYHFKPSTLGQRSRAAVSRLLEKLYTDEAWDPIVRYGIEPQKPPRPESHEMDHRMVTEHCGQLNPLDLDEYRSHEGFSALKECYQMKSDEIIQTIIKSGLRGRGGGGFPTGEKWSIVAQAPGMEKYLVCNGDEGDPGAFMDRMILESFPYRVIEGMTIAAFALGVKEGYLYVRAEYPLAMLRVREAIQLCEKSGLLGTNIMDSGHDFNIHVVAGAGAFVCGEETALMAAVEGRRGMPRLRPPYPSESGLWGKPTLVNNVETYALVPWIMRKGADAFATLGTAQSKGTKAFALAGKIRNSGLIEVPMGMTLRQIVEEIGGGIPEDRNLKAIQVGGPSGGCVPAHLADTPVDYEALTSAGAMMGSGGMVVLDETDCMLDIARYFMTFTQLESCGKCTFCRVGTKRMLEILDRLCTGEGRKGDIERLEQLSASISSGSLCGLGKTAPNPVMSTLTYFREEYQAHIEGRCPAGKCKALITYSITDDCIGCTRCAQRCGAGAIAMTPYEVHRIDPEKCTRCDTCRQVCPVDAVHVE